MPVRNIIKIDEEKCNGCGQCVVDCAEGALKIVDGKAKLVKDSYCDGLGACLGNCPTGALTIEQREAEEFSLPEGVGHAAPAPKAMHAHSSCPGSSGATPMAAFGGGCPGSRSRQFHAAPTEAPTDSPAAPSALSHWPIQLHLVNFGAPQFQNREILIAADCSAFACGAFHPRLLQGKALAIACPKLDDPSGYLEKLAGMFQHANPSKVTVTRMEVPCCRGIAQWVLSARQQSGSSVPVEEIILGVEGDILSRNVY